MTIKELSDVAGTSQETVRRTAKGLFPDKFVNGVRTIFDEYQSMQIMRDVSKKNMVAPQSVELPTQSVEVIAQAVAMAMQTVMMPMMEKLMNMNNQPLQIEQPKQDYFSLLAYCSLHKIKVNSSELRKMGMDLRKIAISKNKELHKIPDERYGQVNSYPVEILDEYFSE